VEKMSIVKMDSALYHFGKFYHKKYLKGHLGSEVGEGVIVMSMLFAFEENGDAVKHLDADGNVTWKATAKFLASTGVEAGPIISFGPHLN
jgi:hypothetical protein